MATENPRVWFKSISLENVRSFGTKQTIYFTEDGTEQGKAAQWNVILGDNGTGKTTVLKGLVLSVLVRYKDAPFLKEYYPLLRTIAHPPEIISVLEEKKAYSEYRKSRKASLYLMYDPQTVAVNQVVFAANEIDGKPINLLGAEETTPMLFAYGAARKIGISGLSNTDQSLISLFDEKAELVNAEEWLMQADYLSYREEKLRGRYDLIRSILLKLFREEISDIHINTESGTPKVFFKTHYGNVRLHELSLGYKTLIAWMVDFAKGLLDRYPDSPNPLAEPAVCLVDEIDLHLHPKFQRTIIKFLTDTFPNTQFIVTAHSPLIVQSAEDANIILLKREGNETHVAEHVDVHSWRIDQILSSDLFGGVSVRPPETEAKMQRRRALLLQDERTYDENLELDQLEDELGMLTSSESKEALKALQLIGKSLSR